MALNEFKVGIRNIEWRILRRLKGTARENRRNEKSNRIRVDARLDAIDNGRLEVQSSGIVSNAIVSGE